MTPRIQFSSVPSSMALSLVLLASACSGRDPDITRQNEDAVIKPGEGEGEGEGETVRQLVDRSLFGTMPVDNRFLDPLFTLSGNGWFAVSADFQNYGVIYMRQLPTPSDTRALSLAGADENPRGTLVLGQYKSGRARQSVSVWVGRDASLDTLDDVTVAVTGTFVGGGDVEAGEQSVDLAPDEATEVVLGNTVWVQFSGTLEEGPLGWANLVVESQSDNEVLLAGPVAQDVPAGAGALVRHAELRPQTQKEQVALRVLRDRMRDQLRTPLLRAPLR